MGQWRLHRATMHTRHTKSLDWWHETARDQDETPRSFGPRPRWGPRRIGPRPRRDRDVEHFVWDETETLVCLKTVSRTRRQDQDHIPDTTYLCTKFDD